MSGYGGVFEDDWTTLTALAFGGTVVQYGVGDGRDTAELAQAANMVISLMPVNLLPAEADPDEVYRAWYDNVLSAHMTQRAMALRCDWPEVSRQLVGPSFTLAVVYPPALPGLSLADVLAEAQRAAYTVAVVHDEVPFRQAAIHAAGNADGWSMIRTGRLWVLRSVPVVRAEHIGEV